MTSASRLDQVLSLNREEYRPLAFFGINIEQDDENIVQWVRWCKKQGFGGFNIIIGSGCEGRAHDAWIEKLLHAYEVAIRTAKEVGLKSDFDDWVIRAVAGVGHTNPSSG